jgi:hypothetical protein
MQHSNTMLSASKTTNLNAAHGKAAQVIGKIVQTTLKGIQQEVASRTYRASNELRNAALFVLRGQRSGRRYRIPGSSVDYTASAPGEAPANRTGLFRLSWGTHVHSQRSGRKYNCIAAIESNLKVGKYLLGDLLENGTTRNASISPAQRQREGLSLAYERRTDRMKPRPYKAAVRARALPKINLIYKTSGHGRMWS